MFFFFIFSAHLQFFVHIGQFFAVFSVIDIDDLSIFSICLFAKKRFQTGMLSTSQTLFIIISQISSSSYRPGDLVENWGSNWVLAGACFLSFLPMIGPAPPLPLLLPTYSFVLPPLLIPPAATNPPSYFHPCPSFSHSSSTPIILSLLLPTPTIVFRPFSSSSTCSTSLLSNHYLFTSFKSHIFLHPSKTLLVIKLFNSTQLKDIFFK